MKCKPSLYNYMWGGAELNRRHRDFQSRALPTELPPPLSADYCSAQPPRSGTNLRRGVLVTFGLANWFKGTYDKPTIKLLAIHDLQAMLGCHLDIRWYRLITLFVEATPLENHILPSSMFAERAGFEPARAS